MRRSHILQGRRRIRPDGGADWLQKNLVFGSFPEVSVPHCGVTTWSEDNPTRSAKRDTIGSKPAPRAYPFQPVSRDAVYQAIISARPWPRSTWQDFRGCLAALLADPEWGDVFRGRPGAINTMRLAWNTCFLHMPGSTAGVTHVPPHVQAVGRRWPAWSARGRLCSWSLDVRPLTRNSHLKLVGTGTD